MKFINLLKKELSELINAHMFMTLGIIVVMFMIMGNLMSTAITDVVEETNNPKVYLSDCDKTDLTSQLLELINEDAEVTMIEFDTDNYAELLKKNDIKDLVVIPKGFTETIEKGERPELQTISAMRSSASLDNISAGSSSAVSIISGSLKHLSYRKLGISEEQYEQLKNVVDVKNTTVIDNKWADISPAAISSKISMQNMALPIALFILVMLTSQSLISSISSEKIDKTLETLLSAPISRMSVISAKMLAAAIVALINAGVMMFSFTFFMKGVTEQTSEEVASIASSLLSPAEAMEKLGLSLSAGDYLLIGLQLFFTIMICLSISIVLGALADDAKSSQTVLLPIMMMVMVPYLLSLFVDINSLPMAARMVVYAIPFTHTFTAMNNLMFGNTSVFLCGLVYQIAIFALCMYFALKLFNSDKILTISHNFRQKSKYKKSQNVSEE